MDIHARRSLLATRQNPQPRLDYVVSLRYPLSGARAVQVRYVPDKLILDDVSFAAYLDALDAIAWSGPEAMAATMLADLNNELVARWVQVALSHTVQTITIEDRQPKWDNPGLLSRLNSG